MNKIKISGIVQNAPLARLSLTSAPGQPEAGDLLAKWGQAGINAQFIVQCLDDHANNHLAVCVAPRDLERAIASIEQPGVAVSYAANVACVGIHGPDFRLRPGIAGAFLAALAQAGIAVQAISTSISTVSAIIAADRLPDAIAAIQQNFELP